jgi:hypothetical protein
MLAIRITSTSTTKALLKVQPLSGTAAVPCTICINGVAIFKAVFRTFVNV